MSIIQNYINGTATELNKLKYVGTGPIISKKVPASLSDNVPKTNAITSRADDLVRFTKLFTRPEGLKHLANESALAKINKENKYKDKTIAGRILANVKDGLFNAALVAGSTLAQVPVNGTGTHFIRGFNLQKNKYLGRSARNASLRGETIATNQVESGLIGQAKSVKEVVDQPTPATNIPPSIKDTELFQAIEKAANFFNIPKVFPSKETSKRYFKKPNLSEIDKLNFLGPLASSGDTIAYQSLGSSRDIIKFNFKLITPGDNAEEPNTTVLFFRALLDDFSDSYTGEWNNQQYVGRAEKFYSYGGFDRDINIGFKVAAMTRSEMKPMYRKIVQLASSTAPTYSTGGFMRGTLTKLTVGDYLVDQPGFIASVDYSWDQSYPWEIKLRDGQNNPNNVDSDVQQLPMVLNVSIRFKPIHNFAPETGYKHYITNPKEDPFFEEDEGTSTATGALLFKANEIDTTPFDGGAIPTKELNINSFNEKPKLSLNSGNLSGFSNFGV